MLILKLLLSFEVVQNILSTDETHQLIPFQGRTLLNLSLRAFLGRDFMSRKSANFKTLRF